jgi:LytS/YehU family sensor histidine kinase
MNSVRALYEDQNAAAQMIDQLASVMRYALQSGHHDTVPLAAESRLQAYLALKIRFEERMRVSVDIGIGLERVRIPPMALQTLVENAVKYGVETSPTGSDIRIRAQRLDNGAVHIEIANLGAIVAVANSTKVGLVNTRNAWRWRWAPTRSWICLKTVAGYAPRYLAGGRLMRALLIDDEPGARRTATPAGGAS